jgi:hypothetical protein
MADLADLRSRRRNNWRQTPQTCIPESKDAAVFIDAVGVATVFPASAEIPNIYHAHVGDPDRKPEAQWDTPAGRVYTWRWELGLADAAFYSVLVRGRPTFVSWGLLSSVLRLRGEPRMPDELYDLGALSDNAYRIAQVLEGAGGVMTTRELREAAGFPAGKEQRNAYLKAVGELDSRLLLAKVFPKDVEEMSHALVHLRYRDYAVQAERMTREDALERFLLTYLPSAVYAVPAFLARDLKLPDSELSASLDRLVNQGVAASAQLEGVKGQCYISQS